MRPCELLRRAIVPGLAMPAHAGMHNGMSVAICFGLMVRVKAVRCTVRPTHATACIGSHVGSGCCTHALPVCTVLCCYTVIAFLLAALNCYARPSWSWTCKRLVRFSYISLNLSACQLCFLFCSRCVMFQAALCAVVDAKVLEERFNICDDETRKIFEALDSSNNED